MSNIGYDRDGRPVDLVLNPGDYITPWNQVYSARDGGFLTVDQYIYVNSERQAIFSQPGYGTAPRNSGIVVSGPDPATSILPGESMPSQHGEAVPTDANAQAAAVAVAIAQDVLSDVERIRQAGGDTPEIRSAQHEIEGAVRDAEAAYDRNDAAAAIAAAEYARGQARGIGIINLAPMPQPVEQIRAIPETLDVIPGFTAAGNVPGLPDNRTVTMQQTTMPEGMTAGELHEAIKEGYAPVRPDGSLYIVTDFQGGFLLDGAPLNTWIDGVWFDGQREALTSYWQSGAIPMPPANVMNLPVVPMPEDVAGNHDVYTATQGGGIGLLAALGLAFSFWKR